MMGSVREAFETARLDAGRLDDAIAVVEAALEAAPACPLVMAYLGALEAMRAGAAVLPWIKMRHAETAATLLDQAYERRLDPGGQGDDWPADLEILLLRGVAYASFPPFLGRSDQARHCLEAAWAHKHFASVSARYRALAHAHLAVLWRRAREEEAARVHLAHARQADVLTADPIWASR